MTIGLHTWDPDDPDYVNQEPKKSRERCQHYKKDLEITRFIFIHSNGSKCSPDAQPTFVCTVKCKCGKEFDGDLTQLLPGD